MMMCAGKMPMKKHENVVVFSASTPTFNEEKVLGSFISQNHSKKGYAYKNKTSSLYNVEGGVDFNWSEFVHANSVLLCNVVGNRDKTKCHATQKPIALMEYFVKTYSNEGESILDPFIGSETTLVAAKNLGRKAVGIERTEQDCENAAKRLEGTFKVDTSPEIG